MNVVNSGQASGSITITTMGSGITGSTMVGRVLPATHIIDEDDVSLDDDEDMDDCGDSYGEDDEMLGVSDVTCQLAAAGWQNGPVGVAAAAAIASAKRKRRNHSFETNPSIRKRQTTRLTRKLKAVIDEFSVRVGQQAIVLVTTPGKNTNNFKVFGAKPLEDVVRSLKNVIMSELETALSQQAPNPPPDDPTLHELPPIVIEGIPTPVEKMTQAQLRAFIPLMLKFSTGRGKPGWGKESTKPPWWPKHVPWANVRMDARNDDEKTKSISWTHALRDIVINCYKYHGRDDLLPKFTEEDDTKRSPQIKKVGPWSGVVQTIANADGTVSIVHVDPNNPVITLPDGTQIQLHESGVHTLAEVATSDGNHELHAEQSHILFTGEDGNAYPVQVSGHQLVTVPVSASMYQTVVANLHAGDGHVQVLGSPIQIAGVSGPVIMKQEPLEHKTITVSTGSLSNSQVSVLQMRRVEDERGDTPDTTS
ncbi:DNA-binding protein P3A2 isoform X2 [Eurytemora carolleeae]|uniref:DNA-binding protein P3A2 isoform X2 n=1 Tax=Eurytemora carolleeae TaxID=1294199 RepID=UPI000C774B06|nr:DNA-binding protein P3A2 isoform X2 [Eurytemora carolleeae]|eukprot:XP_023338157.1 DNA-binding protein P3A2-like isoform X2 [Eurytemora affinis]